MIMKTTKLFLLMAIPVILASCNDQSGNKSRDNNNRKDKNKANSTRDIDTVSQSSFLPFPGIFNDQDEDMEFVRDAASSGLMEVELGNLAGEKAVNPRVKAFGAMMVRDHQKANEELKSIASGKNMNVPDEMLDKERDMVENLQNESGDDFDKAFMKHMVSAHDKDVSLFRKQSEDGKVEELKAFAAKVLPILEMHQDSAKSIRDALK